MRTLIILCLTLICQLSFSQNLKTKKVKSRPYTEIFTIDKQTNKKQGNYRMFQKYKDTTVLEISGQYSQDIKIDKWVYNYYHDSLVYDYSKKSILNLPKLINDCDSFYVKVDSLYKLSKVELPPIYLGYWDNIYDIFGWSNEINTNEFRNSNSTGRFILSGIITKNGDFENFEVEESSSPNYNYTLLKVMKTIKGEWLPAKINGKPVDSKIYIQIMILPSSINIPKVWDKLYYLKIYKTY